MTDDEKSYYESRSKQESVTIAEWCFVAICILLALYAIFRVLA